MNNGLEIKRFLKCLSHGDTFQVFFDTKIDKRFIVLLCPRDNRVLVIEEKDLNEDVDIL